MGDRRERKLNHDLQGTRGKAALGPSRPQPSSECPGTTQDAPTVTAGFCHPRKGQAKSVGEDTGASALLGPASLLAQLLTSVPPAQPRSPARAGPGGHHTKTLARASAPALAMRALLGWQATAWMASSCFLRWAVISCTHVLLSRLHRRREQSWPAQVWAERAVTQ